MNQIDEILGLENLQEAFKKIIEGMHLRTCKEDMLEFKYMQAPIFFAMRLLKPFIDDNVLIKTYYTKIFDKLFKEHTAEGALFSNTEMMKESNFKIIKEVFEVLLKEKYEKKE